MQNKSYLKLFAVILGCFVLSGCSVTYNVAIDKSLGVTEKAVIEDGNKTLEKTYGSIESGVSNLLNSYKSSGETYEYVFRETYGESKSGVQTKADYADLNQFKSLSPLAKQYVEDFKIDETESEIDMVIKVFYPFDSEDIDNNLFQKLTISFQSAYKVKEHNAEQVDTNTGYYTWRLDPDHPSKEIEMKINKNSPLKDNKVEVLPFKFSFELVYFLIIGGIVVVIGFFIFKEHFRSNRL